MDDPFGLVGAVLSGNYRLDRVIGEGGFGVVYRGAHLSLEQPIAVKVLKGLDGADPRINELVHEKFRLEARLLYTLSQSSLHIVRALDFGATTTPAGIWAPFIVLEWLEGRSLADDLTDRRARGYRGRSLGEAFALLEPVAEGLSVAHRQNVAHRDLKPANVFLLAASSKDGALDAKVLDFGVAKIMKEGESVGTKGTLASFTWLYAAPEQLDPRVGPTGLATDVYAFALLVTELLTDRRPVDEDGVAGIMRAAMDPVRRPTPRERGANVPDEIEAVCQRALAVDPSARYGNVTELWAALAAAQRGSRAITTIRPSPVGHVPPRAGHPSGHQITARPALGPMTAVPMSYGPSPPPGTAPPGRGAVAAWGAGVGSPRSPGQPAFVPTPGTSPVVVFTIIAFVMAVFLAGSCAAIHACAKL